MKVIGFRCSPKCIRFAIVEIEPGAADGKLLNASDESRLMYPNGMEAIDEKLTWLSNEVDRLIHKHSDLDKAVIKANEYGQETKAKRASVSADAVIMLCCAKAKIPVEAKIYGRLSTTSAKVQAHAEHRIGRTDKYWDRQMADAVVAAWSGRK